MARTKNAARRGGRGGAKHTTNPHVKPQDGSGKPMKKKGKGGDQNQKSKAKQQQHRRPIIPFQKGDRVLLVGEGDFSFSASLATHHGIHRLLATCYDSEAMLNQKYPQAKKHIEQIHHAETASKLKLKRKRDDDDDENEASVSEHEDGKYDDNDEKDDDKEPPYPKVLYSIDARKLGSTGGGGKLLRKGLPRPLPSSSSRPKPWEKKKPTTTKPPTPGGVDGGPWDVIAFNFPHVGGLSTDVNRQVRANQELLVGFFKACGPLLSVPMSAEERAAAEASDEEDYGGFDGDDEMEEGVKEKIKPRTEPGQVVVTLFEGEPYTLWNIKDLARHAGLRVVTSFKFPWTAYPGYSHARTLGEIVGKDGGRGGWRGEDREARSYVFERKDHENLGQKAGGKRKRGDDDYSDDE